MSVLCAFLGHDYSATFTQPEERFERIYSKLLDEPVWYERFDHDCERCGKHFRVWRWTREAAAKMLETEGRA